MTKRSLDLLLRTFAHFPSYCSAKTLVPRRYQGSYSLSRGADISLRTSAISMQAHDKIKVKLFVREAYHRANPGRGYKSRNERGTYWPACALYSSRRGRYLERMEPAL